MKAFGWVRSLGVALLVGSFLGLISMPERATEYFDRDGYSRIEAEVLSQFGGRTKYVNVRLSSTGEVMGVTRSTFVDPKLGARLPVWYNPRARFVLGVTWYDRRLIAADRRPKLVDGSAVVGWLLATVVLGAAGGYLVTRPKPGGAGNRS